MSETVLFESLKVQEDKAHLDRNSASPLNNDDLKQLFDHLTDKACQCLVISSPQLNEEEAQKILTYIQENNEVIINIDLPDHLKDTRTQVEIDNSISNNRLKKNIQSLEVKPSNVAEVPQRSLKRVFSKRKKPRIEITLNENNTSPPLTPLVEESTAQFSSLSELTLKTKPVLAKLVTELLTLSAQNEELTRWNNITNREEALKFRSEITRTFSINNHPLSKIIENNEELKDLPQWMDTLQFKKEQYDALLDVYGQYGVSGLSLIISSWNEYNKDEHRRDAFLDTYKYLLKFMPSFLPFIEDKEFESTILNISMLSREHRSWWMALIKNQGTLKEYRNLSQLFGKFSATIVSIEKMGLTFKEISSLKEVADLETATSQILTLLNQCPPQDQAVQWDCCHEITVPSNHDYHFIIPEMKLEEDLGSKGDLEWIKTDKSSKPEQVKPAFYRYLAKRAQHLPLEQYELILKELLSNTEINNEEKTWLIYILAKTTSTDDKLGFDPKSVLVEWNNFKNAMIKMESVDRMKANRSLLGRKAFEGHIYSMGGYTFLRKEALQPIMEMPVTPPMSYLNKLLRLSEYKYLDEKLSLLGMSKLQKEMMKNMDVSALLYNNYPEAMKKAIKLIKADTLKANRDGKYIPEQKDINLLEKFINTSGLLTNAQHNTLNTSELNPKQTLLPLLSIFHLEYETQEVLTEQLLKPYLNRMQHPNNLKYQEKLITLFPYALSLLSLIENRDHPKPLDYLTLNTILENLLQLICRSEPTTKKMLREWLQENYSENFQGINLLDIKDEVDFSALFSALAFSDKSICSSIEKVVSNFDSDEEKDTHEKLVRSLVSLEQNPPEKLSKKQRLSFYEFCNEAFKTNGLLSRSLHQGPPSYIAQFQGLIETLKKKDCYEEFEQYMRIAQKGDVTDTIAKFNYLMNTLYPALKDKGFSQKDAFIFGADTVIINSLKSLQTSHENAIVDVSIPEELPKLKTAFDLINNPHSELSQVDKLRALHSALKDIIKLSNNTEQFTVCRDLISRVDAILAAIEKRTEDQTKQTYLKRVFSFFDFLHTPAPYIPSPTLEELKSLDRGLPPELFMEESQLYQDLMTIKTAENQTFEKLIAHVYDKKNQLTQKYENIAIRSNDFIKMALGSGTNDIGKAHNDVVNLINNLIDLDNQNLVLSLMYHYSGGLPERGAQELMELFSSEDYINLPRTLRKDFLHALITQMNNSVKCSKHEIKQFLSFIYLNKNNQTTQYLKDLYKHAPYPGLSKFMMWMQSKPDSINEIYERFDKEPCAVRGHDGREKDNSFILESAKKTIAMMPEVQHVFTPTYLEAISKEQASVKTLSTQTILTELKQYEKKSPKNHIKLVILAAELLHRCKGRAPEFVGKSQIMGRSYELNTTQIIAILATLETGNKIAAEIGTGEGKSRVMMILNACQFLKGNTVDFLTSNLALAERDYLESLPFFQSLGAELNLITSASKIEDYKLEGINVSDPENFCLFRNKAFEQKKLGLVVNPDPKKRALLLDEADVTFFDVTHLEYNYSVIEENTLTEFYPLLMEFFSQGETTQIYIENKSRCNEKLLNHIKVRNPVLFKMLSSVPISKLEKLQDAAYVALQLEYNVDYTIVSNATLSTPLGERPIAAAMCLIGSRISKNAQFADGVHQCLHAELNRLLKCQVPPPKLPPGLKEALEECKEKKRNFNIDPESRVTFRSSSNSLLKTYAKGSIHAVTGTIGSLLEQKEAQNEFGVNFIHVPRHNGVKRVDRPTRVALTEEKQLDALVEHILQSRKRNQPVLLICKNDNDSKLLYEELEKRLQSKRNREGLPKLTRIHAGIEYSKTLSEAEYIKNDAGKPGQVTITTEMEGRGVDIALHNKAHKYGLKVLLTYLPHGERSYGQIIGRSGRYGALGETQMVLNLDSLKEDFGINKLNTDFYLNPEDFIRKLQVFASHTQELRRLFYRTYDNYLTYFSERYKTFNTSAKLTSEWINFLEQYTQSKELTYGAIEAQLEHSKPSVAVINEQLTLHNTKVNELWSDFITHLPSSIKDAEQKIATPELKKPKELKLWLKELEQIKLASVMVEDEQKVHVREHYDPTAAGSVQIVTKPTFLISLIGDFRASWRNEGIIFPNFRALMAGKLSFYNFLSQLPFFNIFIKPREETHIIKKEVSASQSVLFKKKNSAIEDDADNEEYPAPNLYYHPLLNSDELSMPPEDVPPASYEGLFKTAATKNPSLEQDQNKVVLTNYKK